MSRYLVYFAALFLVVSTSSVASSLTLEEIKRAEGVESVELSSEYRCPKSNELEEIEIWLEHAALLQQVGVSTEETARFTEKAKQVADDYGKTLSKRTPCTADEEDIYCALRVIEIVQFAGSEGGAEKLLEWTRKAFRAFAADVSRMTTPKTRNKLAAQADKIGLSDVQVALLTGEKVKTSCVLDWRVDVDVRYSSKMEGVECKWEASLKFPNVHVTGWRSVAGGYLPPMSKYHDWITNSLMVKESAYFDGGRWVPCRVTGTQQWQLSVELSEENGKPASAKDNIPFLLSIHPVKSSTSSRCDDGVSSPLMGLGGSRGPWMIPIGKIAKGKPFTEKFKVSEDDGEVKIDFKFSPK